ncbi:MAG: O-antigen ligase family protein [Candidatus Hydrogenedentes bacterium]|nr:O-antigen ligase family protein [Candidatus Hydrogenedentota bacterium]
MQRLLIALWFLALVLALLPYTSDPTEPIKRLLTDGFVLLIALAGIPLAWKQGVYLRSPLTVTLLIWMGAQFAAALLSDYPLFSLAALRPFMTLFLLYLFVAQAFGTPAQGWRFFLVVICAAMLASLYGYAQHFGYDPFPWAQRDIEEYRGLPATYGNPNFAGHTLVLALVLAAGLIAAQGSWWVILPASVLLGHLWLTNMRGGWVALASAAALTFGALITRRAIARPGRRALVAVAIALLIGVAGAVAGGVALQQTRGTWLPLDSSLLLRYNSYFSASEMLLDRPALGFGPGVYALDIAAYWTPYEEQWFASEGRRNTHVHNDFLEAGIDAGAPGILLYALVLALGILAALRLAGEARTRGLGITLAAALAAFAADGVFGFNLRVPVSAGLFFALLGIVEGLSRPDGRGSRTAAALLPILAAGLAAAGALVFAGEIFYQRAAGAQYWAGRFHEEGRPNDYANALANADLALDQGQRLMPWDPRFPLSLGVNALNRADWTGAQRYIERAVQLAPNNVPALIRMAQAALNDGLAGDTGALDTAEEYATRAAALCAPLPEAQEVLGRVAFLRAASLAESGQPAQAPWEAAADHLQAALRYGAENRFPLQKLLAKVYLNLGNWGDMRLALLQGAETNPADEELWRLFHSYVSESGDAGTMANALHRAMQMLLQQQPPNNDALAILALQLASLYDGPLAQPAVARQLIADAIRRSPDDLRLWGAFVAAIPQEDRDREISALLADSLSPQVPAFIGVLRDPAQAAPELLIQSAQQLVAVARRATAERAARDLAWIATELLENALSKTLSNADRAQLYAALGEVYLVAEDYQEAEPMFRAAVPELAGDERAMALALQSEALAKLGRAGEGLGLAQQAANLAPNTWRVRWMLARRLADMGRFAEAKFEYASLLRTFRLPEDFRAMMEAELAALENQT